MSKDVVEIEHENVDEVVVENVDENVVVDEVGL